MYWDMELYNSCVMYTIWQGAGGRAGSLRGPLIGPPVGPHRAKKRNFINMGELLTAPAVYITSLNKASCLVGFTKKQNAHTPVVFT